MAAVVQVDPNEVRAAASRWQMIGADLGAGGAPPVGLATSWPNAAATAGILYRPPVGLNRHCFPVTSRWRDGQVAMMVGNGMMVEARCQ